MKNMKKILLLNPPYHKKCIRGYYCSHFPQGDYLWPPIDFLVLDGKLRNLFDVEVIDAIAEGLTIEQVLKRTDRIFPDYIVCLVGEVSAETDKESILKIKKKFLKIKVTITGDFVRCFPKWSLKYFEVADAVLLDFTSDEILSFLKDKNERHYDAIYFKDMPKTDLHSSEKKDYFSYSPPDYEKFKLERYNLPFSRSRKLVSVLTTFGCSLRCTYCNYGNFNIKYRDLDNLFRELDVIQKQGIKEIFFQDTIMGGNKERLKMICRQMISEGYSFHWSAEYYTDYVDSEVIKLMKKAGCFMLMMGVETSAEKILRKHRRTVNTKNTRRAFEICREEGLPSMAHVLFGFSGETPEMSKETIKYVNNLPCLYATFNRVTVTPGTTLWKQLYPEIKEEKMTVSDIKSKEIFPKDNKSIMKIQSRAYLSFYSKPKRILNIIFSIRSFTQLRNIVKNFLVSIKYIISGKV